MVRRICDAAQLNSCRCRRRHRDEPCTASATASHTDRQLHSRLFEIPCRWATIGHTDAGRSRRSGAHSPAPAALRRSDPQRFEREGCGFGRRLMRAGPSKQARRRRATPPRAAVRLNPARRPLPAPASCRPRPSRHRRRCIRPGRSRRARRGRRRAGPARMARCQAHGA